MRAQNSPVPHPWPSCPWLPQGLAFPGGVVRGAAWKRLGGAQAAVAERRRLGPWQALQPPLGHLFRGEALALGGRECNQASHPRRICGAGEVGGRIARKQANHFRLRCTETRFTS